jgi:hypothetical protein
MNALTPREAARRERNALLATGAFAHTDSLFFHPAKER